MAIFLNWPHKKNGHFSKIAKIAIFAILHVPIEELHVKSSVFDLRESSVLDFTRFSANRPITDFLRKISKIRGGPIFDANWRPAGRLGRVWGKAIELLC